MTLKSTVLALRGITAEDEDVLLSVLPSCKSLGEEMKDSQKDSEFRFKVLLLFYFEPVLFISLFYTALVKKKNCSVIDLNIMGGEVIASFFSHISEGEKVSITSYKFITINIHDLWWF